MQTNKDKAQYQQQQHRPIYINCLISLFWLFLLLLCNFGVVVFLLIYSCGSTITDEQPQNYMVKTTLTTTARKRSIYINCSIFLFWLFIFLLCKFVAAAVVVVHLQLQMNNNSMKEYQQQQYRALYINCSVFKSSYLLFIFQCIS